MLTLLIYNPYMLHIGNYLQEDYANLLTTPSSVEMVLEVLQDRTLRCSGNENPFLPCMQITTFQLMVPSFLF